MKQNDSFGKARIPSWASWPAIIIAFIVFWPVGIIFLWKRLSVDKRASMVSGRVIRIIGWCGIGITALGLFAGLTSGFASEDFGFITFFALAGIALILFGKKITANSNNHKKYIDVIINHEITSLDKIAEIMKFSYDKVRIDLQKMIDKGYFQNTYIDESIREIVLPKHTAAPSSIQQNIKQPVEESLAVIACSGCGANNRIPSGSIGECEFCGSAISA